MCVCRHVYIYINYIHSHILWGFFCLELFDRVCVKEYLNRLYIWLSLHVRYDSLYFSLAYDKEID